MTRDPRLPHPFWRVELWWFDTIHRTMVSAGADIPIGEAATAEQAIVTAKLWRQVITPVSRITVQYRDPTQERTQRQ